MVRLPSLNAVRAFEAAARLGSFNRAAEELHVTSSAVSHQVRALEEYLGGKLFRRLIRQVQLTTEGRLYLGPIRDALTAGADPPRHRADRPRPAPRAAHHQRGAFLHGRLVDAAAEPVPAGASRHRGPIERLGGADRSVSECVYYLVYREERAEHPKVAAFRDWLLEVVPAAGESLEEGTDAVG